MVFWKIRDHKKISMSNWISTECLPKIYVPFEIASLWLGFVSRIQGLAAVAVNPCEDIVLDQSLDRLRRFVLDDAVTDSEKYYWFTETPEYQTSVYQKLEICVRSIFWRICAISDAICIQ